MNKSAHLWFILCTILFLFSFGCNTYKSLHQPLTEFGRRDIEAKEISYILDCIKTKSSLDSLIEWKVYGKEKNEIIDAFEYKSRLAFFEISKDTMNTPILKSIEYYRNSYQKFIFVNKDEGNYKVTDQTRFNVWMSKDYLSIYFCLIDKEDVKIWALTNGNWVYQYSVD